MTSTLCTYLVSYSTGGPLRPGVARGEALVDVSSLGSFEPSAKAILAAGQLDAVIAAGERALDAGTSVLDRKSVRLGPPIPDPDKIICLGLNYLDHANEAAMKVPTAPVLFPKWRNSLIGPFDDIVVPPAAVNALDYEVELAVIIGRRAARVKSGDAFDYIAGYSAFNDMSARDLQMQTSQWAPGKAIDTFAPMGPGLVPASRVGDPQKLMLKTTVNGTILQHESTSQMIFKIPEIIAFITSFTTLEPGDVIATGTPAGVGFARKPPVILKQGDIVEIEIEEIGQLRNKIVFE